MQDENIVTEESRWYEHFEQLLNRPRPPVLAHIPESEEDLDTNLGSINMTDVKKAIQQ